MLVYQRVFCSIITWGKIHSWKVSSCCSVGILLEYVAGCCWYVDPITQILWPKWTRPFWCVRSLTAGCTWARPVKKSLPKCLFHGTFIYKETMELPARYIQIWGFPAYVSSNPGIFHVCSLRSKTGPHKYHISMNTSVPRGWSSWNAASAGLDSKIGEAQTSWVTQLRMRVASSICLHVMWPTERSDHIDPRDWKCLADQEGIFVLSIYFHILSYTHIVCVQLFVWFIVFIYNNISEWVFLNVFGKINPKENPDSSINRKQIWFILPPRHSCQVIIKKKSCILNMRSIPWDVQFFRCEAFGDLKLSGSCPSRAQLDFFERSVTYFQRNGVIERIVTHFQNIV